MICGLISGVSGFLGRHLSQELSRRLWKVVGIDQQTNDLLMEFHQIDVHDRSTLYQILIQTRPDVIFHLAGVLKSERPEQFYTAHVLGTVSLFEVLVKTGLRPLVVIASSSAVYGAGRGARPITENFQPRPVTHYAVSKLAQELVAMRCHRAFGLPVICVRMFNLLGPGLSPLMACSDFARQIASAEHRGQPALLSTGNLTARRDFVDVRDAVRAYALLAEKGRAGQVYNVASGKAISIQECLDALRARARVPVESAPDPSRLQQNDVPVQVGSAERLRRQTGWQVEIPVEQSLADLLEDWRQKVNLEQR